MSRLRNFWERHGDAQMPLRAFFRVAEKANWETFADLRSSFPSADVVGDKVVFNIAGNRYRLVSLVDFQRKGVLIRWIGTHAEYDRLRIEEL